MGEKKTPRFLPWRGKKKHGLRNTDERKRLSIDPSLISSNIFYRCGGDLVVTPFIFQSNIYFSFPREKEKVAALWRTEKTGGWRGERSLHSSCTRVLLTQRKTWWKEKRKYIYILCDCMLTLYIYTYTDLFSALISWRVFHVAALS